MWMGTRGWYLDPSGRHQWRYWDGLRWSDAVADVGDTWVTRDHWQPTAVDAPPDADRASPAVQTQLQTALEQDWEQRKPNGCMIAVVTVVILVVLAIVGIAEMLDDIDFTDEPMFPDAPVEPVLPSTEAPDLLAQLRAMHGDRPWIGLVQAITPTSDESEVVEVTTSIVVSDGLTAEETNDAVVICQAVWSLAGVEPTVVYADDTVTALTSDSGDCTPAPTAVPAPSP
jgi:hypothetical protein